MRDFISPNTHDEFVVISRLCVLFTVTWKIFDGQPQEKATFPETAAASISSHIDRDETLVFPSGHNTDYDCIYRDVEKLEYFLLSSNHIYRGDSRSTSVRESFELVL